MYARACSMVTISRLSIVHDAISARVDRRLHSNCQACSDEITYNFQIELADKL